MKSEMGDGRWEMGDGRWKMGDGRWKMGDGRWFMKKIRMDNFIKRFFLKSLLLGIGLFSIGTISSAQPILPPRTITVNATQSLYFGTICVHGLGGTVILGYDGSRSSTGNVTLLPTAPTATPAIFEIKLCQGRSVIISFDAFTMLAG